MNLTIAYLSLSKLPSHEANSVQVVHMCQAFQHQGADVTLHAQRGKNDISERSVEDFYGFERNFDVSLHDHPDIKKIGGFVYARRVLSAVRSGPRPDVLYGRHVVSLLFAQRLAIPSFYEVHEPPGPRVKAILERRLFRSPYFHGMIAISHSLADWYRTHHPELPDSMIVVEPDAAALPANHNLRQSSPTRDRADRIRVGYVGRMYPGKGIETVIPLAQRLAEHEFHVVGGTDNDIRDVVGNVEFPQNLHIHGRVPHRHVSELLAGFDVVLAPYRTHVAGRDGGDLAQWMSPLKVFEYLAHGRALVASDLPVLKEVLTDHSTALLCDPDDLDAWVAAIEALAADPDLRQRLGDAGRALVEKSFTWEGRASRLLSVMASAVS